MIDTQDFTDYPVFGENSSKTAPNSQKYPTGFIQADVLPAEWMNWAWYHNTKGITDLNTGLKITEQELNAILTAAGITPDEETAGQIRDAIQALIAAKTGTLSNLATTAKTNLVAALNEVVSALSTGLAGKQDTLTFDTTPTSGSSNPVTSGGIYNTLENQKTYNISIATSFDDCLPSKLQKSKKTRIRTSDIDGVNGLWIIETNSVGHDTNSSYRFITQQAKKVPISTITSIAYVRNGYSIDSGETYTYSSWQQLATTSDLTTAVAALPRSESGTGNTFPLSLGTAPTKSAIVTLQHTNSDNHCSYIFRCVDNILVKHTIETSGTTITLGPSTSNEYPILVSSDTSLVNYWSVLYF